MFFNIDKVSTHSDGSKTALPTETYRQSNTFLNRYQELLTDEMYENTYDEDNKEYRNYNFGYEIYDDSQSRKIDEGIYLSEHDLRILEQKYPLNFGFDL